MENSEVITHIVKRDGTTQQFDSKKITAAITKAAEATGEFDADTAKKLMDNFSYARLSDIVRVVFFYIQDNYDNNGQFLMMQGCLRLSVLSSLLFNGNQCG